MGGLRAAHPLVRDVESISNLRGHDTSRAFFYKAKGALSENKKDSSMFIAKSWGHVPIVPPGSYVSAPSYLCMQL